MLYLYAALIEEGQAQVTLDTIFRNYHKQMLYVAFQILGDTHEAEDAVQDAFIGIARNMGKLSRGEDGLNRSYVLTAAKNKNCSNYFFHIDIPFFFVDNVTVGAY